jgi:hypothetical protein
MKDGLLGAVEITEEQDPPKSTVNSMSPPTPPVYMLGTTDVTSTDIMLSSPIPKDLFIELFCTVNTIKHSTFTN